MSLCSYSLARNGRMFGLGLAALALALPGAASAQTICMVAEIDGAQEPTASPAKGTGVFIVDTAANTMSFQITFDGLTAAQTSAHIHGYAPAGSPGGVKFALPVGNHITGTWFYPPADEASILAGLAYVNIHTAAFPGGEIRGQILSTKSNAVLAGLIDGPQEPTASPALGTGFFLVDTAANTILFQSTHTASTMLGTETSAHIHGYAPPGSPAGVKFSLPTGFHKKGTWFYPQADEANLLAGLSYINIHSSPGFAGGEIRGQMLLVSSCDATNYCTAGTSASGCNATLSASGVPSATCPSGFVISASGVEGDKDGLFFYGTNGPQAVTWGNGTSFQCVTPPVKRGGLLNATGTNGACDGSFSQDLNARWCPTCPKSSHNPGAGTTMQGQLWYRDPFNTSNQTTSLSDAMEWTVCP